MLHLRAQKSTCPRNEPTTTATTANGSDASLRGSSTFFGDASVYLLANIANAAVPFLLLPALARMLEPAELGQVAMFQAAITVLGAFVGLNVQGAVSVQYYKMSRDDFAQFVSVVLMILATTSLIVAIVAALSAPSIEQWTNLSRYWLLCAVCVAIAQFAVYLRLVIWQVRRQPRPYGQLQVGITLLNAFLTVLLVIVLAWGAAGRMWAIMIATAFGAIVSLHMLNSSQSITWRWNWRMAREALAFGIPLIPHTLGSMGVVLADRFVVSRQLGVAATGSYFVATQLALPLVILGDSFNRAFVPWLYERLAAKHRHQAVLATYLAIVSFAIIGVLYASTLIWVLPLIVGSQYEDMRWITFILVIGGIFQASYYAVVNYMFYAQKTIYLSVVTLVGGAGYVSGAWFICAAYGLWGLAWWFLFVQSAVFISVWVIGSAVFPLPWLQVRALARLAKDLISREKN